MAQVVLEAVSKIYPGGVKAVDAVDLTIADREFVVLVGPSGCGKSTTLRMIAGLEDISGGTIRIGDHVVNGVAPKDRNIAMVFQNYALYPHMTVYQNMAFSLKLRKKYGGPLAWLAQRSAYLAEEADIDRRVRETATMLGIQDLLHRRPRELSGGQRQRVAVGRAIVREPKAFLFDEPLSNLDAKLRVEMRAEIKRLHRRMQTTTVYVTHDQEEAMTLGDRVVVMKNGIVHQCASPFEVYEHPVNRFVAGFVGTPPMNFLEGRIVKEGEQLCFDAGDCCLVLCPAHQKRLAPQLNQTVIAGVRPEAMRPMTAAAPGTSFPAQVAVTEPLGDRMDIFVDTPRRKHIVSRVESRLRIREGEAVQMHVEMDRVHFFAPDGDGRNISLAAQ